MRILLDECVPRKFRLHLGGHTVQTVPGAGLAGLKNGALLSAAEQLKFDVLVTVDKGIAHQQSPLGRKISVLVVRVKTNRLKDLLPCAEECLRILDGIRPGDLIRIGF
jgi:hypothetical protein